MQYAYGKTKRRRLKGSGLFFFLVACAIGVFFVKGGVLEADSEALPEAETETDKVIFSEPLVKEEAPLYTVEENLRFQKVDDLIGINDVVFQLETDAETAAESIRKEVVTALDLDKLYDFEYLRTQFYLVQKESGFVASDVDVDGFIAVDLRLLSGVNAPQVLVFHTHSNEFYADSDRSDPMDGVMGVGQRLVELLNQSGIQTLHHTGRYDIVNGRSQIAGAYERMEPTIRKILDTYPSIELVIDLHRDGVREGVAPMVTDIGGQRAAKIMLVNGLCKINQNGIVTPAPGLSTPYLFENMALSFQVQLAANSLYPDFTRKIYLKPYRYSLHMLPKSLLIEIGAQNNTKAEALNAMPPLVDILKEVLQGSVRP